MDPVTIYQVSDRIAAHLRRLEQDQASNPRDKWGSKFYQADAFVNIVGVRVIYTAYLDTGRVSLNERDALCYLAWLDGGGAGTFAEMNGVVDQRWAAASNGVGQ